MHASAPRPTRADLEHAEVVFDRGPRKPRVLRIEQGGRAYAVKDTSQMRGWRRPLWRSWLRRETRVYRALAGVEGLAPCFGMIDRDALLLGYLDSEIVCRESISQQQPDFFRRLERLVDAVHARGWVHLDLGHRRNVLVMHDGRPAIVDLAGALPWAAVPVLGRIGRWIDRRSVRRLERRYGAHRAETALLR